MQDEAAAVEGRRAHLAAVHESSSAGGDFADDASHSGPATGGGTAPGVPVQQNRFEGFSEDELLSLSFALIWARTTTGKEDKTIDGLAREVVSSLFAGSIRDAARQAARESA